MAIVDPNIPIGRMTSSVGWKNGWHGCRNDGTLTASAGDDRPAGSHLHDRRGHVAMGAAAAERARCRRR